jgi:L-alanine-DL-glutamate epimerase-like enolase superfamily enzyme
MLLIFVELSSGHIGIGECWMAGIGIDAISEVYEKKLMGAVLSKSPPRARAELQNCLAQAIATNDKACAAAISGLDCALWDAEAKHQNTPLYELLGGHHRDVYSYASGGLYDDSKGLPELAEDVCAYVAHGFDAVKIKVGGVSIQEDVERVRAAREALGPDIKLMIDANAALTAEDALSLSNYLLDQNIYWFEEPCTDGLTTLREKCKMSICGYEKEIGRQSFKELVEPGLVDFVQFDLSMCGGITEGLEILKVAGSIPVSLHGSSSVALFLTNLQFAAAFEIVESVEYHMVHQWSLANIDGHGFKPEEGILKVSSAPGIGLMLDSEFQYHAATH